MKEVSSYLSLAAPPWSLITLKTNENDLLEISFCISQTSCQDEVQFIFFKSLSSTTTTTTTTHIKSVFFPVQAFYEATDADV